MGTRRNAVLIVGLMACVLPLGLAAAEDNRLAELPVLAAPPPVAEPFGGRDLVGSVPADPLRTGSLREIALPALPDAPVTISTADLLPAALQHRLVDGKGIWPARLPKRDRDGIAAAYAARNHAPLWASAEGWTERARSVAARLGRAAEDGLDAAAYAPPVLQAGKDLSPAELAEADIRLSAAAALFARDLRGGRVEPARLSALLTPTLDLPAADVVITSLLAASGPGLALETYSPRHAGYLALKAKLAELRANGGQVAGREVHGSGFEFTTQAIAILDDAPRPSRTRARPPGARLESEIIANMERWRWLPADLGSRYVAVNVPEFRLRLFDEGKVVHETRVITGKPDSPTPIFSGLMEYAIVNPSWYVPPSILKNEFLPRMAADPSYAERQGYQVVRHGNAISIRQPPGERNALGFIKFMFPNGHAVYLHDTPNRRLFTSARRAFSHGCVRVEDPFRLADFVLGSEWTETRLKRLIGRGERTIWLPQKLPVHLMYFTLSVDEFGELKRFEDVYGHDRRLRTALGLS